MKTKICTYPKCGKMFPATGDYFYRNKSKKDGLNSWCKDCCAKHQGRWYKDNKEKILKQCKQYREIHKEEIVVYREVHKEKRNEQTKQWHKQYPDYLKRWQKDHKEERSGYAKQYNQEHKKERCVYKKQWDKDNRDKCNAHLANYKAQKLRATPTWANKEVIQFYYIVASTMADYEVDHWKPLSKGGLHHEDNLQLLEISLNRQKHNKWPLTKEEQEKYKGIKL